MPLRCLRVTSGVRYILVGFVDVLKTRVDSRTGRMTQTGYCEIVNQGLDDHEALAKHWV